MRGLKIALPLFAMVSSFKVAAHNLDVYGSNPKEAAHILKQYSAELIEFENFFDKITQDFMRNRDITKDIEALRPKKEALVEKIKKDGDYLYVNFDTIYYDGNKHYTTIEVIRKNQQERMRFVNSEEHVQRPPQKQDLIAKMTEFEKLQMKLFMTNQLQSNDYICPVYHCLGDFKHPQLAPYLNAFNDGVVKERTLVLNTMNHDSNPERRTSAIFLLGHLNNPKEIIALLLPQVNDKNEFVRNAAMRVIGATMAKANIEQIDVMPFIKLLDSPMDTDRNKSLLILLQAAKSEPAKTILAQQAGPQLLALLQLLQPNNHLPAYDILKRISGKEFAEYDVNAWKNWLNSVSQRA
ncbi:HEAT repeat domain-containing protein [Legionella jordanis]|uniref:HEAT repeat protein n=1 Tax=Legionella jordanis TaxID=456 RepID=A0A0W0V7L2_9GAMM|nr:HEAT repeat domain-containing protein [Legionella jordanis]KTD16129.1 hypothetical protein Ljor_0435 [Legionella jordanis]RMX04643.1 HEAT repeat domain-containing protein [Legionella jordanis]RMX18353.1 HEAT repeat domain-containing protein [Legionella jordanis]VEH12411.1 Uncharacterised protein [Legionella jordanis]